MNRISQWALNLVTGIFFFIFFLFVTFPLETIVQGALSRVEKISGGQYRVTATDIKPSLIFKSSFKHFQLHDLSRGEDVILVDFPEIKIGLKYLPLITGKIQAHFTAKGKKGSINGLVILSKSEQRLRVDVDKLDLENVPVLSKKLKVEMAGQIDGNINLKIFPGEPQENTGEIDLKLVNFKIQPTRLTPFPGLDIDLPETLLSEASAGQIRISLDKGKVRVKNIKLPGPDIGIDLKGVLQLNKKSGFSKLNFLGTFSLSDKVKDKFPFLIMIDKQKNEDGSFPLRITGNTSKPRIQIGDFDLSSFQG